jgi:hypothetical protein
MEHPQVKDAINHTPVIDTPANRRAMPKADVDPWVSPADGACIIAFLAAEEAGQLRGAGSRRSARPAPHRMDEPRSVLGTWAYDW